MVLSIHGSIKYNRVNSLNNIRLIFYAVYGSKINPGIENCGVCFLKLAITVTTLLVHIST